MAFKKPERHAMRAKILIMGDAKCGKTHALLTFPKVAVIDNEGSIDLFEDRFPDFVAETTKDIRTMRDRMRDVRQGRVPDIETLGLDGLTGLYNTLQLGVSKSDGAIEQAGWGQLKRLLNDVLDELYYKTDTHVVATVRTKPKAEKDVKSDSEMFQGGEVADCDRSVSYAFDLIFKIEVEKGRRQVRCMGSRYSEFKRDQVWPLPDGASFYEIVRPVIDARKDAPPPPKVATDSDNLGRTRALFNPPPSTQELQELARRAKVKWTVGWMDQNVVVPDPDKGILPLAQREKKELYDDERHILKDKLLVIIAELEQAATEAGEELPPPEEPPHNEGGVGARAPLQGALFATLAEIGVKSKEERIAFAARHGVAIESYSQLSTAQMRALLDAAKGTAAFMGVA